MRLVCVVVVLVLALLVRVEMISRAEAVASDSGTYIAMARELHLAPTGEVLRAYDYHPGYAAMTAALGRLSAAETPEQWIRAGRAVSLTMGMVALVCFYAVARAAFNHAVALLALLTVCLSPRLSELSCDPLSDTPALAFALAAVAVGIYAGRRGRDGFWRAIPAAGAAGVAAGVGYLFRPEALLSGGIAAVLLIPAVRLKRRPRKVSLLSLAALVLAVVACAAPYAATIGGFTQKKTLEDFVGLVPAAGPVLASVTAGTGIPVALWQVLDRGRAAMGNTVFALSLVCWVTWLVRYGFRVRLPEGIVYRPKRDVAMVMVVAVGVMIPLLTALEVQRADGGRYVSSRHMLLSATLLAPAAGAGLLTLAGWAMVLTRRLGAKARPQLTLLLCIGAAVVASAAETNFIPHAGKAPLRVAGGAVRFTLGDGTRGLVTQGRAAMYAGSPPVQFRPETAGRFRIRTQDLASPQALLKRAEHAGDISYVVIDTRFLDTSGRGEIIAELREHDRFHQLGVFGVGEPSEVHVFVLGAATDEPGVTRPDMPAPGSTRRPPF